jgi:tetratricopeptide (TPR) repeat protein
LIVIATLFGSPTPDDAKDVLRKGVAAQTRRDYDEAITCFTELIRLQPNNPVAYAFRGQAFRGKGELDKAIADLKWA